MGFINGITIEKIIFLMPLFDFISDDVMEEILEYVDDELNIKHLQDISDVLDSRGYLTKKIRRHVGINRFENNNKFIEFNIDATGDMNSFKFGRITPYLEVISIGDS